MFLPSFQEVPCRSPRAVLCPSPRENHCFESSEENKTKLECYWTWTRDCKIHDFLGAFDRCIWTPNSAVTWQTVFTCFYSQSRVFASTRWHVMGNVCQDLIPRAQASRIERGTEEGTLNFQVLSRIFRISESRKQRLVHNVHKVRNALNWCWHQDWFVPQDGAEFDTGSAGCSSCFPNLIQR